MIFYTVMLDATNPDVATVAPHQTEDEAINSAGAVAGLTGQTVHVMKVLGRVTPLMRPTKWTPVDQECGSGNPALETAAQRVAANFYVPKPVPEPKEDE